MEFTLVGIKPLRKLWLLRSLDRSFRRLSRVFGVIHLDIKRMALAAQILAFRPVSQKESAHRGSGWLD
ncbi:unnamed protein product [Bursaphelenchus xylophilus]|uniref:(pine wood nematode) hypothetical protein n=1 Tax=Bursaphelenchus xylophilus TaxID=6326 RepID=A0A7I8X425_BURXY|nr:unnamed protein product [Bursaphelenchus xylophilus]CAG9128909.1 unnamed protein product [Bursaphelenchus xylophilus]